ncbi:hypothetical protein ACQK5W_00210 [Pantoea sp. FN060301]|uniref:hypothetical protein n=1 Tax=Pantoea sp. FN060301 TaxID=3420380 RepID=UPI003D167745
MKKFLIPVVMAAGIAILGAYETFATQHTFMTLLSLISTATLSSSLIVDKFKGIS